jgi:lipoate-protein ligase A
MAQTFYEAVAQAVDEGLAPNTILLCQPASPYVCLGYNQDLERDLDVEYCRGRGLPIIRRSQGGGATYLDSNQIFYQVVAGKDSGVIPLRIEGFFERLLAVTVYVCRRLGLPAEFKALNDVIVNGRKISGNGAGEFGKGTRILVGNIILDIDYDAMSRVLRVPDEKFRDKMAKSMREWVTSLQGELGYIPEIQQIKELLMEGYEKLLGIKLTPMEPMEEEKRIWEEEVKPRHLSEEWLLKPRRRLREAPPGVSIRVADGVRVVEAEHKAKKLIRARAEILGNKILDITLSGDFFMMPRDNLSDLEERLKGATLDRGEILERIEGFYNVGGVQVPGIAPEDFAETLMKLKELVEKDLRRIYPYAEMEKKSSKGD